ncbi:MAG: archaeal proteasome endopeptidase complex subunit beta [Candidatus Nanoarchaeia archaeon]|nr:archaeal proteasome endopeptidase complex subunit beta [Candidatus Nanoarchaeia archaeon]MDD5053873.1 archaeal proteasome endopeptidase complex subunit beta [Candidatus Nanoarchaeia archaeon]MDD5499976.1 archaeal proteasome endopeptidase complex subunit beta [Candidatus Nanoarchaeia archaeon]
MENETKKGTTTVGIVTKEGIVLAADKRASMGYLIADKDAEKIHFINDNAAMTFAGSVADSQMLLRYLKTELRLYSIKKGRVMTTNGIVTLLSHFLFGNAHSFSPFLIQFIVAGVDDSGFHLYDLDMAGSKMEKSYYTSTGSGSPIAFGVLEDSYQKNLTLNEGVKLAVRAISSAIKRDLATGNGIDVMIIDKSGAKRFDKKKLSEMVSNINEF